MRISELTRRLRRIGMRRLRHGGQHDVWINPNNDNRASIPRHQNQEISERLVRKILGDLGLKREDL